MVFLEYIVLAALVVFFAIRLSYYVDCLDKLSNLSGAFIGGVILAAVTSLPELFTSLTAVIALDEPRLIQGNVLGSNLFNVCVIAGILLVAYKGYQNASLSKSHKSTLLYGLAMYVTVLLAVMFPISIDLGFININLMTVAILVIYFINVRFMKNDDSAASEEDEEITLTLKQVVIRFVLYAIALVLTSILLTQVTDRLAEELQMGTTVAGALFLGVATSLPELSASINLVRMKNYNASFGNIVGSNLFNFIILAFADLIYVKGGVYVNEPQVYNMILFGMCSSILCYLLIVCKNKKWIVMACSVGILASYVASIVLSM